MAGDLHRISTIDLFKMESGTPEPSVANGKSKSYFSIGDVESNNFSYPAGLPAAKQSSRVNISKDISALYGILVLISGLCAVPLAESIDDFNADNLRWAETVYLVVAIAFLFFCFTFLFRPPTTKIVCGPAGEIPEAPNLFNITKLRIRKAFGLISKEDEVCIRVTVREHLMHQSVDSGSLYLKVGCVIFGVGSIVYSGIVLGLYFENYSCFSMAMGLNPILWIVFIVLQLLFIFRNSQFTITKYVAVGRLGLTHLVVVNLLICIRVIVDETVHSFREISNKEKEELRIQQTTGTSDSRESSEEDQPRRNAGGTGAYLTSCVSQQSIMKYALETSTIFLYPCIIEYALISAGIIFTMWRGVGHNTPPAVDKPKTTRRRFSIFRPKSAFRINCDQALGGLFAGLVVMSGVIVGIIIFFMARSHPAWLENGTMDWIIMDIILHSMGIVAAVYCAIRFIRKLGIIDIQSFNVDLDDSLLMFSMIGVYAYCITSLLGASRLAMCNPKSRTLSLVNSALILIQTTLQSIFLFDASKRAVKGGTSTELGQTNGRHKPGRQMLTFLLVVNFALWIVHVFCMLRIDGTPCQADFYGARTWALITHTTVPIIIFYRFHSTACIFEVWKRAYREPKDNKLEQ